jgi:ribonuclease P protein 3
LCYFCKEEIEDKSEVERLCYVLKSHSQYLDSKTQESLILGFSITEKWREGLKLLSEGDKTYSLPINAMIDCFLKHNQIKTAVLWMNKAISKEHVISDFIYEHWLRKCAVQQDLWNNFFDFLIHSGVFLKTSIIQQLKDILENRHTDPFVGHLTTIDEATGRCRSCEKLLQNPEISDDEFADLKKSLMERVLLGTDVYLGSKPDEIRRFQKFLKDTAPYDVVIDGLNVAYHRSAKNPFPTSMKLEAVSNTIFVLRCEILYPLL